MNNFGAGGNAFGGFPGGYNQTPGGMMPNANMGLGGNILGANLPSVDPNNFPGTVHFGPSTTMLSSGAVTSMDPMVAANVAANLNSGF